MNQQTGLANASAAVLGPDTRSTKLGSEETPQKKEVGLQVYTVEQIADVLQIGRDKVYMLLRTGQLRSIKIGRLRRITARQLADFIASVEE
ncbi:helix-turn-helix domain-containing protein [Actinomadura nitritigenes]|uniref:helix-turn-helix domain-containing protein n=1 Tax=Actinomadura nitritigenes TaxID=134602 RepID=UPI0036B64CA3